MTGISRRNLLKGAAFSAAGVAALGLAGCAPQTEATKADAALAETGEAAKHTWEVKPEPIAADQISQTVDTEVLVIGGGYSGTCCALSAAQNGAKTILVEKDAVLNGHGVGGTGAIASRALDDLGLKFDKSLEMERWVSTCGNRCRESLVGKWFRESERCMNWFLDMAEANGAKCMVTVGSNSTVHPEIACYHFMSGGPIFEEHTMADFVEYMFEAEALKAGAEFVYEMPAVQLVQDESGKVTGAICQNKSGEYVQYNASKGVVLATGDISYSDEYINEFAPVANRVFTRLCSDQGNVGDGHNMAAWAGGAFQEGPWPTMMHPQAAATFHGPFLFVNPDGKRFMNEATWVQGKCLGVMYNGGADHAWSIFDANWQNDLLGSLEHGGGMVWDTFRPYGSDYQAAVDGHTKTVENGLTEVPDYYKRADTLEELAELIEVDPAELKATVERYNKLCKAGEDTDFFKENHFLFPIEQGPFTAVSATAKSAERATLSRRRRPRFPAGGATALWPPALPRAAAQGALDRGVVEVRGPDLNLQRRGALGVPGRDRPARDLPSAELREPDRHRDVLCAERGQPPRGVRGPHDCPLSGSPSPSAASASRSFMR